MSLIQLILLPFSWLYRLITDIRNWLYHRGYKKSIRFPLPVISVGNLTVGGTGKTPHTEYLVRLLQGRCKLATLSRGYGRKTRGFLLAGPQTTAGDIGDEPMQFYQKFSSRIQVAVGEKRAEAISKLLSLHPGTEIIILDDAFQHRAVQPSLSIMLSDYNKPFYRDYLLPAGRLRERRSGARRADIVIVSKCPEDLTAGQKKEIMENISRYTCKRIPIFFTGIRYGKPVSFGNASLPLPEKILLVSGLADPKPLEDYLQTKYHICYHLVFRDHHFYTAKDIEAMAYQLQTHQASGILLTEKDYVKLKHPLFSSHIQAFPFYYLPIEVYFLFGEEQAFNEKVLNSLQEPAK